MVHSFIGDLGHLFIIIAFVSSLVAALGYYFASNTQLEGGIAWNKFSRVAFFVHTVSVLGVIISLFTIIYNKYYEYHYAWEHSSNNLPIHFMISCFWEGQEGSFLLWIFWHSVLGITLIVTNKKWESPVMSIFSLVQAFLCSMILGVVIYKLKIGSSPFILLRDYMTDAPIFKMNPDFVPKDGTGLNPLLQNYWMVIHPPTLFLGFATTLIPFSFCIAGLWLKKYKEWIRPALPWALFSALVLGVGILMGGYWAYETLNFGGYWNWDPVENAVYVPWLVLVASIHTMIIFKNNETALRLSVILVIATFILILYSTFLTRSGILGNASVHSFTDLGLSGQLLIYLLVFLGISIALVSVSWKNIPLSSSESTIYNREFWIFLGITTLSLAAFHVLFVTSFPVYNAVAKGFGLKGNLAPPADAMAHYGMWQLWFSVGIALFSGTGQFFYWKKLDKQKLSETFYTPLIITALVIIGIFTFSSGYFQYKPEYLILLVVCLYSIVSNSFILVNLFKNNIKLAGGAISHIGIATMLIGILYSSGYSKVVSINNSGLLYSKEFSADMNRDNVLLFRNSAVKMGEYELTYRGPRVESSGFPGYLNKEKLLFTANPDQAVTFKDVEYKGKLYYKKGDTIKVAGENTYYEVEYKKENGETFVLYPRAQVNPQMGFLASPDIKRAWFSDLYTHVSSVPDPSEEKEWSDLQEQMVHVGDTFFVNDYIAVLEKVERVATIEEHGIALGPNDAAVKAHITVMEKDKDYHIMPTYIIKDMLVGRIPEIVNDLGLKLYFLNIDPEKQEFTFGIQTTQKDWIILKAAEKPLINLLWLGTGLVCVGLCVAISRRYSEFKQMRDKGIE